MDFFIGLLIFIIVFLFALYLQGRENQESLKRSYERQKEKQEEELKYTQQQLYEERRKNAELKK